MRDTKEGTTCSVSEGRYTYDNNLYKHRVVNLRLYVRFLYGDFGMRTKIWFDNCLIKFLSTNRVPNMEDIYIRYFTPVISYNYHMVYANSILTHCVAEALNQHPPVSK